MTADEMVMRFDVLANHWAIVKWRDRCVAAPSAVHDLPFFSVSKTAGDLLRYIRHRVLQEPVPAALIEEIRQLADLETRAQFERLHAELEARHE